MTTIATVNVRPSNVAEGGTTMNAQEKAITARRAAAKGRTARKLAAKKAAPAAADRKNRVNVGQTCSVKGCTHPASRRGLCSGKDTNRHYRAWLKEQGAKNA